MTKTMTATIANALRDSATLGEITAMLDSWSARDLCAYGEWCGAMGEIISNGDRFALMEATGYAVIHAGERADACREGTRSNLRHLGQMELLSSAKDHLVDVSCRKLAARRAAA